MEMVRINKAGTNNYGSWAQVQWTEYAADSDFGISRLALLATRTLLEIDTEHEIPKALLEKALKNEGKT